MGFKKNGKETLHGNETYPDLAPVQKQSRTFYLDCAPYNSLTFISMQPMVTNLYTGAHH